MQLALYASTQGTAILCSLFLGLAETGTYSVMFQFGQATYQLSGAYARSFFPAFQSAFTTGELERQRSIASIGLGMHALSYIAITIVVCALALPLLPIFRPDIDIDYRLYLGIAAYLFLWNQHSVCCSFIISMNEIPYMKGYVVAAALGIALSAALMSLCGFGTWGLVVGQTASQIVYNNWKWPKYLLDKLGLGYFEAVASGIKSFISGLRHSP